MHANIIPSRAYASAYKEALELVSRRLLREVLYPQLGSSVHQYGVALDPALVAIAMEVVHPFFNTFDGMDREAAREAVANALGITEEA